jgi:YfiR/HmsC-like
LHPVLTHKTFCSVVLATILVLLLTRAVVAPAADPQEYQVKAAMLYNVAKFVEWPVDTTTRPLQVCVIGRNPFGVALESLQGKQVHGRPLNIRQVSRIDEIGTCQILFVSSSERRNLAAIVGNGALPGVLTISDLDRFADSGGVVGLVDVDGKIKLEVNLAAAQKAKLKIGSQMLKLARIVREAGP